VQKTSLQADSLVEKVPLLWSLNLWKERFSLEELAVALLPNLSKEKNFLVLHAL